MWWGILLVLALGILMFWLTTLKRNLTKADRKIVSKQWDMVEKLFIQKRFKESILEADKTFDFVLKRMNIKGVTMGERLKNTKSFLINYHDVWEAHKIRNKFVHEVNYQIEERKAQEVIRVFRRAIKSLKVL